MNLWFCRLTYGRLLDQFGTLAMKHIRCYGFPWVVCHEEIGDRGPRRVPGLVTHRGERAWGRPSAMKVDCLVQKVTLLDTCVLTGYQHVLTMMRSVVHKRSLGRDNRGESWGFAKRGPFRITVGKALASTLRLPFTC